MMKKILFVAIAGCSLALSAPAARAETLTNAALKKLFPGNYTVQIFGSFPLTVQMSAGGGIKGVAKGKNDTGRWSIEGNRLCIAWNTWTKGKKNCSTLKRDGKILRGTGFTMRA
jgi:hypothetical protein